MTRADLLQGLPAWAEAYYPERVIPPPAGLEFVVLTAPELVALFERTTSRLCHLALIDQAPIRKSVEGYRRRPEWYAVSDAVRSSWRRHPEF